MQPNGITPQLVLYTNTWNYIVSSVNLTFGEWAHIVGTYDGSVERIYVNGVETGNRLISGHIVTNDVPLQIGAHCLSGDYNWFKGTIDESRVYNRALSAEEIKAHYEGNVKPGKPRTIVVSPSATADVNSLGQNYPNPFNPATTIEYSVAQDCQVTIKLYNVGGEEVATLVDEWQTAGPHKVVFNQSDELSRGIYYYQVKAGSFVDTKKMVVLK